MEIKDFDEVIINENCYSANIDELSGLDPGELDYEGYVLWKGSLLELLHSKYSYIVSELEEFEDISEVIEVGYDWVVIYNEKTSETTLFNYDCDPCGVICLK